MGKLNLSKTYLAKALQPIHIGTGGYQVERVDNKIMRDEKNVPVIPGTALSGATRNYMALDFKRNCGGKKGCGEQDCVVCMTFGFSKEEGTNRSRQGMVQIYDAMLLLFPIGTVYGPVWVTSPSRLDGFLQKQEGKPLFNLDKIQLEENDFLQLGEESDLDKDDLNLGWLVFKNKKADIKIDRTAFTNFFKKLEINHTVAKRIICLSDAMFAHVVDSNLEKRTSVSINPLTNTADSGALFTYEAVPQTSYFYFTVTYNDPRGFYEAEQLSLYTQKCTSRDGGIQAVEANCNCSKISSNETAKLDFTQCLPHWMEDAMRYIRFLGIGGMTTRGFGRLEVWRVDV